MKTINTFSEFNEVRSQYHNSGKMWKQSAESQKMELAVECQKRAEGSKPNALRRSGMIPAVLYGHKGCESISLTIKAKTVEQLLKKRVVNNALIDLSIPELSWSGKTLLREVQVHPWKGYPYHLSFFSVASQDSLEVELSLRFVGALV